jgi:hypothetical protein
MQTVTHETMRNDGTVGYEEENSPNKYYLEAVRNARLLPVPMPTRLNFRDRGGNLQTDGYRTTYTPTITETVQDEPCLIRANHFIPPACGLFYFEVHVISAPAQSALAIGVCTRGAHREGYLPGQEKHSQQQQSATTTLIVCTYGYESSKGQKLAGTIEGERYGPAWGSGDVIGCCVDYMNDCINFTKNGSNLGVAFQGCGLGEGFRGNMFPCIGLSQQGQCIEVNFGIKPFRYDLSGLVSECREMTRLDIVRQASTPSLTKIRHLTDRLVLDYLRHHGYADTAARFARDVEDGAEKISDKGDEEDKDSANRRDICKYIIEGDLVSAINSIQTYYPELLSRRIDIMFAIKCQCFVELIRNTIQDHMEDLENNQIEIQIPCIDAVNFGRRELVPLMLTISAQNEQDQELEKQNEEDLRHKDERLEKQKRLLRDVFSLLAYRDPRQSPVSYLLSDDRRHELARKVNRAALKYTNRSKDTAIEKCIRQGYVVIDSLVANSQSPIASMLYLEDFM